MLPSLDNFLSYGADIIKARQDYKQMFVDIYTNSITNEQLGENDRVNGSKLGESILLNLRGAIDDVRCLKALIHMLLIDLLINSIYKPSFLLHLGLLTRRRHLHSDLPILKCLSILFCITHPPPST